MLDSLEYGFDVEVVGAVGVDVVESGGLMWARDRMGGLHRVGNEPGVGQAGQPLPPWAKAGYRIAMRPQPTDVLEIEIEIGSQVAVCNIIGPASRGLAVPVRG